MTDAHVHVERGPYEREWIGRFVERAKETGVTRLQLLEHTHRFREFAPLYEGALGYEDVKQREWLSRKLTYRLTDYLRLVDAMRGINWGIDVRWGLEVCYVPEKEDFLRGILPGLGLDFLAGSVHHIDGWGFDLNAGSWAGREVDAVWHRYHEIMRALAESRLFTQLCHPDSMKVFGFRPAEDLSAIQRELAAACRDGGLEVEVSAGLANNHAADPGGSSLGIDQPLFGILAEGGVSFVTASDAHRPEDVGRRVAECEALIAGVAIGREVA